VVGGMVRDSLMDLDSKDIDIEVHGIEATLLQSVLASLGSVNEIGKSFGVFKVVIEEVPMDVSIPRRDSQAGPRHKDVVVVGDPLMGIEEAARRRDLTINAIAFDPLTGDYSDPFGGIQDLERGRLTAVDPTTFMEDPLRALRVVQFAARFGFSLHEELLPLCREARLVSLPAERVWGEIEKLLMRAPAPSLGWEVGRHTGAIAQVLPEAAAQPRAQIEATLDRAAELRDDMDHAGRATALMISAMLHRLDPAAAEASLNRLKVFRLHDYPVRERVLQAVALWPTLAKPCTDTQLRIIADQTEILLAASVAWAVTGRRDALYNIDTAFRLGVPTAPLPALVQGKDLLDLGLDAGPALGQMLEAVRAAQLEGTLTSATQAIEWIKATLSDSVE